MVLARYRASVRRRLPRAATRRQQPREYGPLTVWIQAASMTHVVDLRCEVTEAKLASYGSKLQSSQWPPQTSTPPRQAGRMGRSARAGRPCVGPSQGTVRLWAASAPSRTPLSAYHRALPSSLAQPGIAWLRAQVGPPSIDQSLLGRAPPRAHPFLQPDLADRSDLGARDSDHPPQRPFIARRRLK